MEMGIRGLARVLRCSAVPLAMTLAVAGCSSTEPDDAGTCSCGSAFVHQALGCRCSADAATADCPRSMDSYDAASTCAQSVPVVRATGCGKISFSSQGYAGGAVIFDQGSQTLVGIYEYSDTAFGPCTSGSTYLYGEGLFPPGTAVGGREGCDDITYCTVCGDSTAMAPPCP